MFFLKKQLIKCSCTYWAFYFCKIFTKFLGLIQSYEDVPFSDPKWPICHEQFFLVQTIIITFIYLLPLFIVQNFKKILSADPELWGCEIFGPKMAHFPKWIFFSENLLMSLVSFINADIRCYMILNIRCQILIY